MREPRWVVEKKWDFSVGDHVLTFPLSVRTLSLAPGLTIFSGPSGEMAGRLWHDFIPGCLHFCCSALVSYVSSLD